VLVKVSNDLYLVGRQLQLPFRCHSHLQRLKPVSCSIVGDFPSQNSHMVCALMESDTPTLPHPIL
jgi:hypothetical protein